ncbi:putative ubiquitin carboxyl-terminal hydrolase FAF-X, partial [Brachionus plicatilis]
NRFLMNTRDRLQLGTIRKSVLVLHKLNLYFMEKSYETLNADLILTDGRFNHTTQIQERLNFLKYLLKEGQLLLCSAQAEIIWKCLAQNSVFESDREICFKWFSKLMTDDPDMEPDMNKKFFTLSYSLIVELNVLSDSSAINYVFTENLDLIGLDYLWKIVTFANEDI